MLKLLMWLAGLVEMAVYLSLQTFVHHRSISAASFLYNVLQTRDVQRKPGQLSLAFVYRRQHRSCSSKPSSPFVGHA